MGKNAWILLWVAVALGVLLGLIGFILCSCSSEGGKSSKKKRGLGRDMALAESSREVAPAETFPTASSYSSTQGSDWDASMPLFGTPALRVPALQPAPGVPMMRAGPPNWA